eukprot:3017796-Pyramimonas_sp.AAC.1
MPAPKPTPTGGALENSAGQEVEHELRLRANAPEAPWGRSRGSGTCQGALGGLRGGAGLRIAIGGPLRGTRRQYQTH